MSQEKPEIDNTPSTQSAEEAANKTAAIEQPLQLPEQKSTAPIDTRKEFEQEFARFKSIKNTPENRKQIDAIQDRMAVFIGNHPVRIDSLAEYDSEMAKIEASINDLEGYFPNGFQPFKKGFWPQFEEITSRLGTRDSRVPPPMPEPTSEKEDLYWKQDEALQDQRDPWQEMYRIVFRGSMVGGHAMFPLQIWTHHLFNDLVVEGALNKGDRRLFFAAMPHWYRHPMSNQNVDKEVLSEIVVREKEALNELKQKPGSKKIDAVIAKLQTQISVFDEAVRSFDSQRIENLPKPPKPRDWQDESFLRKIMKVGTDQAYREDVAAQGVDPDSVIEFYQFLSNDKNLLSTEMAHNFLAYTPDEIVSLNKMLKHCGHTLSDLAKRVK